MSWVDPSPNVAHTQTHVAFSARHRIPLSTRDVRDHVLPSVMINRV